MNRADHWQNVYTRKSERDLSWFEASPDASIRMLEAAGLARGTCVIDVGGGDSRLVDALVARGLTCVAVLDISAAALQRARDRLGESGAAVTWIEADVTDEWSSPPMDIWHDRAVFHFLTQPGDRARYTTALRRTLRTGGTAIVAAFAPDGPERCSGLTVVRYSPSALAAELGSEFLLVESMPHLHRTPASVAQPFHYLRFLRVP